MLCSRTHDHGYSGMRKVEHIGKHTLRHARTMGHQDEQVASMPPALIDRSIHLLERGQKSRVVVARGGRNRCYVCQINHHKVISKQLV